MNYNQRSAAMWAIINENVDFKKKSVIDYGFGYGDMLLYAREAGAFLPVGGVEKNIGIVTRFKRERLVEEGVADKNFAVRAVSIDNIVRWWMEKDKALYASNIAFCFSVLPYLEEPTDFLRYLYENHSVALIECQYAGDGPGFDWLAGDFEMSDWLHTAGWQDVVAIGKTYVLDRDCYRTIWKCKE